MAYKVQYLPVTGALSGESFEKQTAAFLEEIGTLAQNAGGSGEEALSVAQEAKQTAENAQTAVSSAANNAEEALSVAGEAKTAAQTAQTTANTAMDTAADAKTTAQAANTTAENAQTAADTVSADLTAFKNTAGTAGGLATLNADGKVTQTALRADTAANAENITLTEPLSIANGGTAANNQVDALNNISGGRIANYGDGELAVVPLEVRAQNNEGAGGRVFLTPSPNFNPAYIDNVANEFRIVGQNGSDVCGVSLNTLNKKLYGWGGAQIEAANAGKVNWGGNIDTSVQSGNGLQYATFWGSNDPTTAANYGIPNAGIGSNFLSMQTENVDGIGNNITGQLFLSNDNTAWLRTNTHGQNIQKSTPWVPILTALNGLTASAFSTVQAFNTGTGEALTLPAGGSWFYFGFEFPYSDMEANKYIGEAFAGVAAGGTVIDGSGTYYAKSGFYFKIA